MTYILAIDPGLSSGIVLGKFNDTEPFERVAFWQVEGGLAGVLEWYKEHWFRGHDEGDDEFEYYGGLWGGRGGASPKFEVPGLDLLVVAEKFTPLTNKGFSLTLDSVEPLRIEGALVAFGLMPADFPDAEHRWARPASMYFSGGSDKASRLKASRAWLKSHGLLATGKQVGCKDANDVNSAQLHAFAHLRKIRHLPTIKHYFPEEGAE